MSISSLSLRMYVCNPETRENYIYVLSIYIHMYIVQVYYIFKVIFKIDGALLSTLSLSIFFALLTIVAILLGITTYYTSLQI